MITDYTPDIENVCTFLFGICCHPNLHNGFCEDCQTHPTKTNLKMIDDLAKGLSASRLDVCGGLLIGKLVRFLTENSEIVFSKEENQFRHGICMHVNTNNGGFADFYAKPAYSFAYQICWLSEILFRLKEGNGTSREDLRRMING